MKKSIFKAIFLVLFFNFVLFSLSARDVKLTQGYDKQNELITCIGQGANETEAVVNALEDLERRIVYEITNRISELSRAASRPAMQDFVRFSAINMTSMSHNILKYATNSSRFKTKNGCIMTYSIKTSSFEEMLEGYMFTSITKDDKLDKTVPEIVSVNRFLKGRYLTPEINTYSVI